MDCLGKKQDLTVPHETQGNASHSAAGGVSAGMEEENQSGLEDLKEPSQLSDSKQNDS